MALEESSDEFNPIATQDVIHAPKHKTAGDYIALAIATCGVGYFPIAPGTMGSLVGVGIYLLLLRAVVRADIALGVTDFSRVYSEWTPSLFLMWILPLFTIALSLIGIWAASI